MTLSWIVFPEEPCNDSKVECLSKKVDHILYVLYWVWLGIHGIGAFLAILLLVYVIRKTLHPPGQVTGVPVYVDIP